MDADSSYGGSDTAQDSHSGHDNSSSLETTHNDVTTTVHDADAQQQEPNNFYHKNEITLPVNYDETDFQDEKSAKQPHYLSTANLNINDTLEHHSNLEEMNKNYKSTSYLNESPRIRKKSNEGVDNPAFQEEEYKPEVKSTFDHNKPYNGDLNSSAMLGLTSPNKNEEPLTEAVNLELINLKPAGKDVTGAYENGTNGMTSIPVKKENDAEIGNPYDEYFVPVNEHRKYMRGEKLYVTMDKRNKKKRNKCLCWGLCLCIVAAAVIIGILAAVGVIGNQGPHPINEISARHFGSSSTNEPQIKTAEVFGLPKDIINDTTTSSETPTHRFTPEPPVATVSSKLPTTETSMIQVPRALESQLVIDNLKFTPELADKNSTEYKQLAKALETDLKNALFSSDMLNYGPADIEVKVMGFASGSVVVKYRITWVFKDGIHNAKDPIDEEMLKRKVQNIMDNHNGVLNSYHVVGNTVTVDRILDACKIDNNECEHNCSFDYNLADFICTCPNGKYLGLDKKSCVDQPPMSEHDHIHFVTPEPEPSSEPEPNTDHHEHLHYHEVEATPEPASEPEPSSEPEPTQDHHEHDHHHDDAEPERTSEPEPKWYPEHDHHYHVVAEPEPTSEPEPSSEPEPNHDHNEYDHHYHVVAEPEPTTEPEPSSEPEPAHDHEHDHHYGVVVEPEPTSEPESEPVPDQHQHSTVTPEPEPSSEPEPLSNEHSDHASMTMEPSHRDHDHYHATMTPEPSSEPKPAPDHDQYDHYLHHEATAEPEPTSEPVTEMKIEEHLHNKETSEPAAPEPEPTNNPAEEPQVKYVHFDTETPAPTSEPKAEPTTEEHVHNTEPMTVVSVEPSAEPTTEKHVHNTEPVMSVPIEPQPEPTTEKHIHNTESAEPNAEPNPEPSAEPTTNPIGERNFVTPLPPDTQEEHATEIISEPKIEHNEITTTVSTVEHSSQQFANHEKEQHIAEPVAEPTSEPNAEPTSVPVSNDKVTFFVTTTSTPSSSSEHNLEVVTMHEDHAVSVEPLAEPTAEPAADNVVKPEPESSFTEQVPTLQPGSEHNTEPAEFTADEKHILTHNIILTNAEHSTENAIGPENKTEHSVQSTNQPIIEEKNILTHEIIPQTSPESTTKSETHREVTPKIIETVTEINADKEVTEIPAVTTIPVVQSSAETVTEMKADEAVTENRVNMIPAVTTIPVVQSSAETVTEISSSHVVSETSSSVENENHVTNSTESSVFNSVEPSLVQTTTSQSAQNDFRHNHLTDEIFAEPEVTTITSNQSQEVSSPSAATEKIETVSSEAPTTSKLPNEQEVSVNIAENTLTPVAESTSPKDTSGVVNASEITTQPILTETSTNKPTSEENLLVPVVVNEQPRLFEVQTTQAPENETMTSQIFVNDQPIILHPNMEPENDTDKNKAEDNTQPTDMTKIFTEIHKVIDNQQSTEATLDTSNNHTHIVESTENTSAMDNMSPFLPEIDNDTFVNKLHLGEHVIPHIQNETHEDEMPETSPPRLDNDQMNVTNPQDTNQTDATLTVVPLEGNENEILSKAAITEAPKVVEETKDTEANYIPVVIQQEVVTTTVATVNATDSQSDNSNLVAKEAEHQVVMSQETITTTTATSVLQDNVTTSNTILNSSDATELPLKPVENSTEMKPTETTTKPSEEPINTTLPPESINNIHNVQSETASEENKTIANVHVNNTNEINTSTEDLIALETTTYGRRISENGVVVDVTTETSKTNHTPTTVHAEVVDTVTESVHFDKNGNESESNSTNVAKEDATTIKTSSDGTTAAVSDDSAHAYEVNEAIADITTTERLFIAVKATTENAITKADYEDLSVVPLNSEEDNDNSKISEKRLVHENINSLEAETNNSVNDISEEHTPTDKFHNLNDVNTVSQIADSTTKKIDELENNTEFGAEVTKYDESKTNKKNYYDKDKPKFEKKVKLEKVITTVTDDELLTTAFPSDKQPQLFSDIKPVTEEFAVPDSVRCTYGQFQCVNGTSIRDGNYCIPENDRCDSVDDCSDGSDEIDCVKHGCPNNFQCASGQCLKRHLVCDGIQNCNDGSDENGCDKWSCRFDEFSCGEGGRCLPILWKCDGRSQCPDGSDEHNCPSTMCTEDSFQCTEQNTCVPRSWKCDGSSDCMNGEDEKSCECTSEEFKCAIGGGCVKNEQMCDGTPQCADKSDEWNCLRLEKESNNKKYLEIKVLNTTWYPVCADRWNHTFSDQICRDLGYGGSVQTENVDKPEDSKEYFKLKPELTYGSSIISQLEKTDSCDSFVSISCQEFSCGSHSPQDVQSARIIGGHPGVETQWPSLTLLYNKRRNLQCTATLIAPIWAIASYSCIFQYNSPTPVSPSDWILYAGSTNFFGNSDNSTTQVGQIKRILPHPQAKFSHFEYTNDVVLVELAKPLTITRNVSAMCLPDKDIEPRQLCVIAGWGVSKPGEPNKNQYLHYLPVPIIDSQECNSTKHYNGLMSKDKICAGYTDAEKTPCYNDEGAPLMCFSDSAGTWELQGVLSHHDNCAKSKHPAIYTSINERMRKWVINTIGQKPARSA